MSSTTGGPSSDPWHPAGFEQLTLLGRGAQGRVYRAWQPGFRRWVAVKVLESALSGGSAAARFEMECQAIGSLSGHPHIIPVFENGVTEGRPYLAMELMPGGTLLEEVGRQGRIPVPEALATMVKLCGGIETAHAAGILHRDIKPGNIMRSQYGEPMIGDFGLARFTDLSASSTSIRATPAHAAPEVLRGSPATVASDVWSLGSTMFELLAGHPPFALPEDEVIHAIVHRTMTAPTPDLRPVGIPDGVCRAVEVALDKEPSRRYPTVRDFGETLRRAQAGLSLPMTVMTVPVERQQAAPPPAYADTPLRSVLRSVVDAQGVGGLSDRSSVLARCHELMPQAERETNLVLVAVEAHAADGLLAEVRGGRSFDDAAPIVAASLCRRYSIEEQAAVWVSGEFAAVLGSLDPILLQSPAPSDPGLHDQETRDDPRRRPPPPEPGPVLPPAPPGPRLEDEETRNDPRRRPLIPDLGGHPVGPPPIPGTAVRGPVKPTRVRFLAAGLVAVTCIPLAIALDETIAHRRAWSVYGYHGQIELAIWGFVVALIVAVATLAPLLRLRRWRVAAVTLLLAVSYPPGIILNLVHDHLHDLVTKGSSVAAPAASSANSAAENAGAAFGLLFFAFIFGLITAGLDRRSARRAARR